MRTVVRGYKTQPSLLPTHSIGRDSWFFSLRRALKPSARFNRYSAWEPNCSNPTSLVYRHYLTSRLNPYRQNYATRSYQKSRRN